jgi:iduronate 2-sulfatase
MWGKQTNFESATRSPLIARAPGHNKAGSRSPALVETVDIFPTLLDLCGLPPLPLTDGRSFVSLLDDPQRPWKEAVFHVFDRHPKVDGKSQLIIGHGVRSASHRLVSWRAGWELSGKEVAVELYDYEKDPFETRNVAADPSYAQTLNRLRALLMELPANKPSMKMEAR